MTKSNKKRLETTQKYPVQRSARINSSTDQKKITKSQQFMANQSEESLSKNNCPKELLFRLFDTNSPCKHLLNEKTWILFIEDLDKIHEQIKRILRDDRSDYHEFAKLEEKYMRLLHFYSMIF